MSVLWVAVDGDAFVGRHCGGVVVGLMDGGCSFDRFVSVTVRGNKTAEGLHGKHNNSAVPQALIGVRSVGTSLASCAMLRHVLLGRVDQAGTPVCRYLVAIWPA
jgi:hypothetical protein